MSSSDKPNMQDSTNEKSSIELDIPTLKLDPQPCCSSQNIEQSITSDALSTPQQKAIASDNGFKLTESFKEMDNEKSLSVSSEEVQKDESAPVTLQPISLETSLIFQSEMITKIKLLSESLKENDTKNSFSSASEKVEEGELAKVTLQPTPLEASSTAESETITGNKMEILTEFLKENDSKNNFNSTSEKVEEDKLASDTLQPTTLATAEITATAESETIASSKTQILSELLKEIDTENINVPLEVLESESASALQPISLAASSSSESETASTSVETLAEKLKGIDIRKKLGLPSEEGQEGESAAMTLSVYLDSINISALISTRHFLSKRAPYLKKLTEEAVKLHAFMETVNNLRHEFQPCRHTSLSCVTLIPESWHRLTRDWEIFQKQIGGLIDTTVLIMQQCDDNSLLLREEFVSYLDNLMVTSEDLGELEEMCNTALDKYRSVCFNYDNYYFLLHLSTASAHLKPLQERLMQECGKFSSFEAEISEQIKQAEKKIDDIFLDS